MIRIPVRTVSELNAHTHWRERARRAKTQRHVTTLMLRSALPTPPALPVVVTLTRIAPRQLDDDNNVGAHKHVRDAVAEWLGVDDRSPLVSWVYAQAKGKPKEYAVTVLVQPRAA